MAGNSVIGALRVVIGADSAALETGLKKASSQLDAFSSKMNKIGLGIAVGATAAFAALGVAIKGSINEADKLGKMAQSIGIPVEELSRLKHAADLSDVSLEALGKSVGILSKRMAAAAADINGEAAQSFKNLGISVRNTDGTLKNSTQVISAVAGKFEGMKDGATKTALAMQIFGRAGAAMIPLLNQSAVGLAEMMQEADQLGIVLDSKTAVAAESFNDNLKRMGKLWDGIILQVTARMLPAFLQMSQVMLDTAKNSDLMQTAADGIVTAIRGSVTVALTAVVAFQRLTTELGAFWEVLKSLKTFDPTAIAAAWASFRAAGEETEARFAGLKGFIDKFWTDSAAAAQTGSAKQKRGLEDIAIASASAGKAFESFINAQAKQLAGQQAEVATFGMAAGAKEKLRIQLEGLAIATANHTTLSAAQKAALDATALAAGNMAMKLAGLKLTDETLLPWEEFNKKLDMNRQLLDASAISAETFARANKRVAEQASADWGTAGASISGSFAQIAGSFGEANSGMAKAAKVFAIVQATISTFTGAAKALELPFPANLAAMATVLAKGFAFVASIKSQKIPSFAHGADFTVGGAPGIDKNLFAMNLSRGERVRVDPAGSTMGGDTRVHVLQGMDPRKLFTGENLRELIGNINAAGRDGYRLDFSPA